MGQVGKTMPLRSLDLRQHRAGAGAQGLDGGTGSFAGVEDESKRTAFNFGSMDHGGEEIPADGAVGHRDGRPVQNSGQSSQTGDVARSVHPNQRTRRKTAAPLRVPVVTPDDWRRGQRVALIATAVSLIRLEKPHSLSYQDMTRTKRPSITWVSCKSKVEEAGLWL